MEARLTLADVAECTGYSIATVKRTVAELRAKKLLTNLRRGVWRIEGINIMIPSKPRAVSTQGINQVIPQKYQNDDTFTILLFSFLDKDKNIDDTTPFTKKQIKLMSSLYCQISELLQGDPLELTVADPGDIQRTYKSWLLNILGSKSRKEAGRFVGAMIRLLKDDRVAGRELQ